MVILRVFLLIWFSFVWQNMAIAKSVYTRNSHVQGSLVLEGSDDQIYASEGGDVSGGGTTVLFENRRTLLDVFFDESAHKKLAEPSFRYTSKAIDQLKALTNDEINLYLNAGFKKIHQSSPELSDLLRQIYEKTPFYIVAGRFKIKDSNYFLNPYLQYPVDSKLATSALNIRGIGIFISRNDFSEMNSFNQAALIMHELFRYLQIHFSVNLKNSEIQNLTRSAMVSRVSFEAALQKSALNFMSKSYVIQLKESLTQVQAQIQKLEEAAILNTLSDLRTKQDQLVKSIKIVDEKSLSKLSWYSILSLHQDMSLNQGQIIEVCSSENSTALPQCQKLFKLFNDLIH